MIKLHLSLLLLLTLCTCVSAQDITLERAYPTVTVNGEALSLPWFGGLNAPQYQAADLDGDGLDDLLIFDRAGQTLLAARRTGPDAFAPAPELLASFPRLENWVAVRDYNGDGVPDLFSHDSPSRGVRLYRGARGDDGLLSFDRVSVNGSDVLTFPFGGNPLDIFVDGLDYPDISDVDGDGDLDLLTFSALGGYLEYYQNLAVERGLGADTLLFSLGAECWGGFFESGLSSKLDLADEAGACSEVGGGLRPAQPRHAGSTILALDYNGDELTDVLLGDVSFTTLTLALNGGTPEEAWITAQDSAWNTDGVEVDIPFFPAAFHLDIDQDGDRDILAAPTTTSNSTDVEVGWLYTNEGSDAAPDFQFSTTSFLTDRMIDVGSRANVTTVDYDADGRTDLVIGNNDQYTGGRFLDSRLRLFRNVSQGDGIAFDLIDPDYLGLSEFAGTTWAYAPAFGDMDGDGDADAVVGERSGKLVYFENTAGPGATATYAPPIFEWLGLDASQFSKPTIADLDRDGLNDLVVGGFDGRIRFYRNVGTSDVPAFDPSVSAPGNLAQLGGIDTRSPGSSTGHPTPVVAQHPEYTLLLTGNSAGQLEAYRFPVGAALDEAFMMVSDSVGGFSAGSFSNPGLGDFDGDGTYELVIGNERGGVEFFRSNLNIDGTVPVRRVVVADYSVEVSPNPSSGLVTFGGWPGGAVDVVEIFDARGRLVHRQELEGALTQVPWDGRGSRAGVYVARFSGARGVVTRRVVLSR